MITRIQILNYRAIQHLDLALGARHVLVGPNGSGKSTLLDAIAFAGDVMRHGPAVAVFGDDRRSIEPRASDSRDLLTMRRGQTFEIAIEAALPEELTRQKPIPSEAHERCRYELALEVPGEGGIRLKAERFWLCPAPPALRVERPKDRFPVVGANRPATLITAPGAESPSGWRRVVDKLVDSGNDYYQGERSAWNSQFRLGPDKSALGNLPQDESLFPTAMWFRRLVLERAQRIALDGGKLRLPGPAGKFGGFLPDGSNLPNAVHALEQAGDTRAAEWLAEVRLAIPDLERITTVERPEDRRRYLVAGYRGGLTIPSYTMSDGTLRLLALTLLPYLDDPPALVMVEEPENGIHPQAVETVYRALMNLSETQAFCATHSPVVVNQASLAEILCFAKTAEGLTDVVRGDEHPRLGEWLGKVDQGTLFANGILS